MMTAVLECYASESYRLVTPEIFEVNMQLKYSESSVETTMFEYIRSGVVFDLGKILAADTDNLPGQASDTIVTNTYWSAKYEMILPDAEDKLQEIVSDFKQEQAAS